MTTNALALAYARPGEEWTMDDDDIRSLVWLSDTDPPTAQDIAAAAQAAAKAESDRLAAEATARDAAIAHAKSLGFTDAMIAVMYPNLVEA